MKVHTTAESIEDAEDKAWQHLCFVDESDVSFYTYEKGNTPEDQLEILREAYEKWGTSDDENAYDDFIKTCEKVL